MIRIILLVLVLYEWITEDQFQIIQAMWTCITSKTNIHLHSSLRHF